MKNTKRILGIIFLLVMTLTLSACGKEEPTVYTVDFGEGGQMEITPEFISTNYNYEDAYSASNLICKIGANLFVGDENGERIKLSKGDTISVELRGFPIVREGKKVLERDKVGLVNSNTLVIDDTQIDIVADDNVELQVEEDGDYYISISNFSTEHYNIENLLIIVKSV